MSSIIKEKKLRLGLAEQLLDPLHGDFFRVDRLVGRHVPGLAHVGPGAVRNVYLC